MVPTVTINVPLNEALAALAPPLEAAAARDAWQAYSSPWQFWNAVRAIAAGGALLLAGWSVMRLGGGGARDVCEPPEGRLESHRTGERRTDMAAATPMLKEQEALSPLASRFVDVDFAALEADAVRRRRDEDPAGRPRHRADDRAVPLAAGRRGCRSTSMSRIEQTYVLEGSILDDEGEVTAGNYVWRPAGKPPTTPWRRTGRWCSACSSSPTSSSTGTSKVRN